MREVSLKSGNLCAFPGCDALIITEDSLFIGQPCHIEAAEKGVVPAPLSFMRREKSWL
jgi:hypothetical protein